MARRAARALVLALPVLLGTAAAHAGPTDVVALPAAPAAESATDAGVATLLPHLDQLVSEAVQDLGLTLSLEPRGIREVPGDSSLVKHARDSWVVLPTLERRPRGLRIRITAVRPGTRVLLTRSELSSPEDLDVRVAVMMRDLMQPCSAPAPLERGPGEAPGAVVADASEPRSSGRAVLALNAAVFGGYVGYSIQAASGSSDERLVYPLVALGTGVGLGASMLVADEWDVTVGGAWYLAAGLWWPTSAGLLLAAHHDVPKKDRYVYGVVAGTGGVALAVASMSLTSVTDGDAALAHSGGAIGMGLGGLTQLFIDGKTSHTPIGGMGYGAAIGTVGAGVIATQLDLKASRVLLVDLGATLGALTGAAAGSPLLLVDEEESKPRTRAWLGSIFAGTVLGAGIGWWSTRKADGGASRASLPALPYAFATPEAHGTRMEAGVFGRF
ncbi:MAG: hypothetical protein EOO73_06980 [Myxococcales bacterium]|nr:MAG: hypothetical protein EOO73_06980 [Myxococcales bacterium]